MTSYCHFIKKYFIIFLTLFISFLASGQGGRIWIKFTGITCHKNDSIISTTECNIKAVNKKLNVINVIITPKVSLNHCFLHLNTYKRLNGWKPWVINGKINMCSFLAGKSHPIFNVLLRDLFEKYTNLNHSCPYNHSIRMTGLNVSEIKLRGSVMPEGFYRFKYSLYMNKAFFFGTNLDVEIGTLF